MDNSGHFLDYYQDVVGGLRPLRVVPLWATVLRDLRKQAA